MFLSTETFHPTVGKAFKFDIILSKPLIFEESSVKAKINGIPYNVRDGKIEYSVIPKYAGNHEFLVELEIDNPFNGTIEHTKKIFRFNVK